MVIGNKVRARMNSVLEVFKIDEDVELNIQEVVECLDLTKAEYAGINTAIWHLTKVKSLIKTYAARGKSGVCKWKLAGKHKARTKAPTLGGPTATVTKLSRREVIEAIKTMGPITSNELAEHFNVTNNSIRKHIEDLRIDGWTLTTTPSDNGTKAKLYSHGGKPTHEDIDALIERCYHLTMALGECTVADLKKTLGLDAEKADTVIKLTAMKCKLRSETTLYSK